MVQEERIVGLEVTRLKSVEVKGKCVEKDHTLPPAVVGHEMIPSEMKWTRKDKDIYNCLYE